ncbi:MAG: flippase-like domain-containing protein [Thermoguttaceae bacterium]|nr:flippase-like domain-containing protein [Thermoguttaceae bacterium]
MSKILSFIVKLSLIAGLFAYLFYRALQGSAFSELDVKSINLSYVVLGFLFNLLATTITIVRWRALVEALGSSFPLNDALKYGFIGFMFNLSPVGIVGGDAVKVALVAKKNKIPVDRATASVVVDRVLGLYAMFVLGLIVLFCTGFYATPHPTAKLATQGLAALTILTTAFLAVVVVPASKNNWREKTAEKIPFIGGFMKKLTAATLIYGNRKKVLFLSFLATFFVHSFFAVSLYFFAKALFGLAPALIDHFILYCVGNVGSVIPLSAGPFEYFLDELYPLFEIAGRTSFEKGHGMAIGVAYRLATVGVALVGVVYYMFARSDVKTALNQEEDVKGDVQ